MRRWILATLIAASFPSAVLAETALPSGTAEIGSANRRPRATATPTNSEARLAEEARQKRWDDRMRRATKSMCNGC